MSIGKFDSRIALENHLNYLYRPGGTLSNEEATGLAAFLNSSLVDRYFRIANGNTQVNATELRKLPLPPLEQLIRIGQRVINLHIKQNSEETEKIIMEELGNGLIVGNEGSTSQPFMTSLNLDATSRKSPGRPRSGSPKYLNI